MVCASTMSFRSTEKETQSRYIKATHSSSSSSRKSNKEPKQKVCCFIWSEQSTLYNFLIKLTLILVSFKADGILGVNGRFAHFVPFRLIKKRSFDLLCVLGILGIKRILKDTQGGLLRHVRPFRWILETLMETNYACILKSEKAGSPVAASCCSV